MKKICCFAGHNKISCGGDVKDKLMQLCRTLIEEYGVNEFRVGNYGCFDKTAAGVIRELKQQGFRADLILLIPYLTQEINENRDQYYKDYDDIVMANIPEKIPHLYRILKCNQYMVDHSDYLIACVSNSYGGAGKTLQYARRKKHIKIFNLADEG